MALPRKDVENWTLDDLLEAVNPAPPTTEEQLRRALVAVIKSWRHGEITDEQATTLIKAIAAAKVNRHFNEMASEVFAPRHRRRGNAARQRFSLR